MVGEGIRAYMDIFSRRELDLRPGVFCFECELLSRESNTRLETISGVFKSLILTGALRRDFLAVD